MNDFSKLPLDKAMVKVKGDGSRKIAIFSDPDCPFCKRLEPELEKLDNVTIYTFLYPLTALHPDAMRKATMVWCSPDRQRAWDDLMLRGKLPEGSLSCATPILEINELARSLGINGTPGIVFESGKLIPGAISSDQIEAQFKSAAS
jgi:thiol:disulfide interchange protein DsbC